MQLADLRHPAPAARRVPSRTEDTMSQSIATTNHDEIRRWVESRKGHPAVVRSTHDNGREGGLLRIDFDPPEQSLERIAWEEFFDTFDDSELAFLYQEETSSGGKSRFNKFVSRDSVDAAATDSGSKATHAKSGAGKASTSASKSHPAHSKTASSKGGKSTH
jgi:hypothetical protein